MANSSIYEQLGYTLFKSGLADVFDIQDTDDVHNDPDGKISVLLGLLRDVANGNVADPADINKWERIGTELTKMET